MDMIVVENRLKVFPEYVTSVTKLEKQSKQINLKHFLPGGAN